MEGAPILICYDGSAEADRAIDAAAALLGSRRAVVLAVAPALTLAESVVKTTSLVPGNAFDDLNEAEALSRAKAGTARAVGAGLHAEPRTEIASTTWEGVVGAANDLDAAVIVLGSRGQAGLEEFARGSVSHDVAAHARQPVLIVPPPVD